MQKTPQKQRMRAFRLSQETWEELTRLAKKYGISRRAVIEMRFRPQDEWQEVFGLREGEGDSMT